MGGCSHNGTEKFITQSTTVGHVTTRSLSSLMPATTNHQEVDLRADLKRHQRPPAETSSDIPKANMQAGLSNIIFELTIYLFSLCDRRRWPPLRTGEVGKGGGDNFWLKTVMVHLKLQNV